MLLLTANESKHLVWVSGAIKNLLAHGIHLLFVLRLISPFLASSLSLFLTFPLPPAAVRYVSHLARAATYSYMYRHYRKFPFRWCHLSITASCCPFAARPRDVYLAPARSAIYRTHANSAVRPIYRIIPIAGPYRCSWYRVPRSRVTDAMADEPWEASIV